VHFGPQTRVPPATMAAPSLPMSALHGECNHAEGWSETREEDLTHTPSERRYMVLGQAEQRDWGLLTASMPDSSYCSSDGSRSRGGGSSSVSGRSAGRGGGGGRGPRARAYGEIAWDEIRLGHVIRSCGHYAHCTDDLRLLGMFFELAGIEEIHGDSVKLLLRTFKFLRLCDYSAEDLCSILAHTSSYFSRVHALCGDQMDGRELGNVLATLMFLAHCFVQDETCPLNVWHRYLFSKYCPLKTLNAAVIRLMELLKYLLRLQDVDLQWRFGSLCAMLQPQEGAAPPVSSPASAAGPSPRQGGSTSRS